jgi:3',5'-cyclic AMP phosphodiesterase CpdA
MAASEIVHGRKIVADGALPAPVPLASSQMVVLFVTGHSHSACDSIRSLEIDAGRIDLKPIPQAPGRAFMDEVDGRPGHVALQSGHMNALQGVPAVSLSQQFPFSNQTVILSNRYKFVILSERSESKDLRLLSFSFLTFGCPIHSAFFAEWVGIHEPD